MSEFDLHLDSEPGDDADDGSSDEFWSALTQEPGIHCINIRDLAIEQRIHDSLFDTATLEALRQNAGPEYFRLRRGDLKESVLLHGKDDASVGLNFYQATENGHTYTRMFGQVCLLKRRVFVTNEVYRCRGEFDPALVKAVTDRVLPIPMSMMYAAFITGAVKCMANREEDEFLHKLGHAMTLDLFKHEVVLNHVLALCNAFMGAL